MNIDLPLEYYVIVGAAVIFLTCCLLCGAFRSDGPESERGYHAGPWC